MNKLFTILSIFSLFALISCGGGKLNVRNLSTTIENGGTFDMGKTYADAGTLYPISKTFIIENTSDEAIELDTPRIVITDGRSDFFKISEYDFYSNMYTSNYVIASKDARVFTVTFSAYASGTFTATITINFKSSFHFKPKDQYNFTVTATASKVNTYTKYTGTPAVLSQTVTATYDAQNNLILSETKDGSGNYTGKSVWEYSNSVISKFSSYNYSGGNFVLSKVREFDSNANIVKSTYYSSGAISDYYVASYDKYNNVTANIHYNAASVLQDSQTDTYDDHLNLLSIVSTDINSALSNYSDVLTYDQNGYLTKIARSNTSNVLQSSTNYSNDRTNKTITVVSYNPATVLKATNTTVYENTNYQYTSVSAYNGSNTLTNLETLNYNTNGYLVSDLKSDLVTPANTVTYTYEYDANNNKTKITKLNSTGAVSSYEIDTYTDGLVTRIDKYDASNAITETNVIQ